MKIIKLRQHHFYDQSPSDKINYLNIRIFLQTFKNIKMLFLTYQKTTMFTQEQRKLREDILSHPKSQFHPPNQNKHLSLKASI